MRQVGGDVSALPVVVTDEGEVLVEDHPIGRLEGFRFTVAHDARAADKRLLLAAAERRLGGERAKRAAALCEAPDHAFALLTEPNAPVAIGWNGLVVATLHSGSTLSRPAVRLDRSLDCLDKATAAAVRERLETWLAHRAAVQVPALARLEAMAGDPAASPELRATAAALIAGGGMTPRGPLIQSIDALDGTARKRLRSAGLIIGTLDLFDPRLLKPEPARWREALLAVRQGRSFAPLAPTGATVLPRQIDSATLANGFRPLGPQAVRVDLVERLARAAHDARDGRKPFAPDPALATSMGLQPETTAKLMAALGFRTAAPVEGRPHWAWRGVDRPAPPPRPSAPRHGAFAALAELTRG
jgi:ATP-dependent RNA helicase SUPV3L1/SUV3